MCDMYVVTTNKCVLETVSFFSCAGQSDSFTYTLTDCNSNSASATVSLIFAAPRTAKDDLYEFAGGQIVKLPPAGVLAYDANAASCQLTSALIATLVNKPSIGAVVLDKDGAFVYTPSNGVASEWWLLLLLPYAFWSGVMVPVAVAASCSACTVSRSRQACCNCAVL
jgi:hypothetical protein